MIVAENGRITADRVGIEFRAGDESISATARPLKCGSSSFNSVLRYETMIRVVLRVLDEFRILK